MKNVFINNFVYQQLDVLTSIDDDGDMNMSVFGPDRPFAVFFLWGGNDIEFYPMDTRHMPSESKIDAICLESTHIDYTPGNPINIPANVSDVAFASSIILGVDKVKGPKTEEYKRDAKAQMLMELWTNPQSTLVETRFPQGPVH